MPGSMGAGSSRSTIPGVSRSLWNANPVSRAGLDRYQNISSGGFWASTRSLSTDLLFLLTSSRNPLLQLKPYASSAAGELNPSRRIVSLAFCARISGEYSGRSRSRALARRVSTAYTVIDASTASSRETATRGERPSPSPAAATISGDGVSPAASAAASGSPPGSAAATASAERGRCAGPAPGSAGSRAPRPGSRSRTTVDRLAGVALLLQPDQSPPACPLRTAACR